ncbi:MAG: mechanosensitive ion channel [Vicingaceae bacterium]|nr:mechanosensitive ion channel [Vicingaceae bacterium]
MSRKNSLFSLTKYVIIVLSIIFGLQIIGFNLSILMAGSAALLVGVGFGLQNLFSDFTSGIILLLDSTIKVNDVIEVGNLVGKVQEINLRTTTVLTREDIYIIIPNTDLTKNQLVNWTYSSISSRFEIKVGVDYSSDVQLVMRLMKEASNHPSVLKNPESFVRFSDYGDSSLDFTLLFWTDKVFRIETIKSDIRIKLFELFSEHKVQIPFPQRVIHVKKEEKDSLTEP